MQNNTTLKKLNNYQLFFKPLGHKKTNKKKDLVNEAVGSILFQMKRADGDEEIEHSTWKIGKLPHADEWPEDGRAEFTPLFAIHTQHYQTGDLITTGPVRAHLELN